MKTLKTRFRRRKSTRDMSQDWTISTPEPTEKNLLTLHNILAASLDLSFSIYTY